MSWREVCAQQASSPDPARRSLVPRQEDPPWDPGNNSSPGGEGRAAPRPSSFARAT